MFYVECFLRMVLYIMFLFKKDIYFFLKVRYCKLKVLNFRFFEVLLEYFWIYCMFSIDIENILNIFIGVIEYIDEMFFIKYVYVYVRLIIL